MCILMACCICNAQTERDILRAVTPYFERYSNSAYNNAERICIHAMGQRYLWCN